MDSPNCFGSSIGDALRSGQVVPQNGDAFKAKPHAKLVGPSWGQTIVKFPSSRRWQLCGRHFQLPSLHGVVPARLPFCGFARFSSPPCGLPSSFICVSPPLRLQFHLILALDLRCSPDVPSVSKRLLTLSPAVREVPVRFPRCRSSQFVSHWSRS
jgi:hypothetical protein